MLHVIINHLVCINRGPDFERGWHEGSNHESSVLDNYWQTTWILSFDCFETITIIITTTIQRNRKTLRGGYKCMLNFYFYATNHHNFSGLKNKKLSQLLCFRSLGVSHVNSLLRV